MLSTDVTSGFPKKFLDAFEARRAGDKQRTLKLLKDVTAGYVGCTDMPCIDFIPELVELHPEAKVVLVKRDPARWWDSVKPLMDNATAWYLPVLTLPMPTTRWFPGIVREWKSHSDTLLGGKPPGPGTFSSLATACSGATRNEETRLTVAVELVEAYDEWVIKSVPKDRLLVMRLGEGWGPLCKFLDKPVPSTPFPQANEAEALEAYTNALLRKLAAIWLGIGVATGGSMYLLWNLCRKS